VHKSTLFVCLALAALTSCSRQKPLSRDELQSKVRSAESIASETGMLIDFVRQGRATQQYAKGHVEYLSAEIARVAQDLNNALAPADVAPEFNEARRQVDALGRELSTIGKRIGHPDELADNQARVAGIRNALQHAGSSL
jgi:hypothetical protein